MREALGSRLYLWLCTWWVSTESLWVSIGKNLAMFFAWRFGGSAKPASGRPRFTRTGVRAGQHRRRWCCKAPS